MPNFDLSSYIQVNERLMLFRKDHPDYALISDVVFDDGQRIVVKATVMAEDGGLVATGHAEEIRGQGMVNKTSALENCETSAWGRALANMGYEVSKSIASRQEMEKVQRMQGEPTALAGRKRAGRTPQQAGERGPKPIEQGLEKVSDLVVKRAQRIHIAAKEAGISEEKLRARIALITGDEEGSAKSLNDTEAQKLLRQIEQHKKKNGAAEEGA